MADKNTVFVKGQGYSVAPEKQANFLKSKGVDPYAVAFMAQPQGQTQTGGTPAPSGEQKVSMSPEAALKQGLITQPEYQKTQEQPKIEVTDSKGNVYYYPSSRGITATDNAVKIGYTDDKGQFQEVKAEPNAILTMKPYSQKSYYEVPESTYLQTKTPARRTLIQPTITQADVTKSQEVGRQLVSTIRREGETAGMTGQFNVTPKDNVIIWTPQSTIEKSQISIVPIGQEEIISKSIMEKSKSAQGLTQAERESYGKSIFDPLTQYVEIISSTPAIPPLAKGAITGAIGLARPIEIMARPETYKILVNTPPGELLTSAAIVGYGMTVGTVQSLITKPVETIGSLAVTALIFGGIEKGLGKIFPEKPITTTVSADVSSFEEISPRFDMTKDISGSISGAYRITSGKFEGLKGNIISASERTSVPEVYATDIITTIPKQELKNVKISKPDGRQVIFGKHLYGKGRRQIHSIRNS